MFSVIMGYYIAQMHVMQNAVRAVRVEFAVRLETPPPPAD